MALFIRFIINKTQFDFNRNERENGAYWVCWRWRFNLESLSSQNMFKSTVRRTKTNHVDKGSDIKNTNMIFLRHISNRLNREKLHKIFTKFISFNSSSTSLIIPHNFPKFKEISLKAPTRKKTSPKRKSHSLCHSKQTKRKCSKIKRFFCFSLKQLFLEKGLLFQILL